MGRPSRGRKIKGDICHAARKKPPPEKRMWKTKFKKKPGKRGKDKVVKETSKARV